MVEVLKLAGPSVILLDELVAFARQLPDDRFEAFLSFIQSLTEAVKIAPNALLVGSLPEAHAEAGGEKGVEALKRLEKVFGRVQSPWMPASGDETYEIIRRRLFQTLDSDGERARDETIKAFHDLYKDKKNAADFPPEAREGRYYDLLRMSYPIHPELFDRLSKDWASLPNFQRTRGVLRFMANVVGVLWHQRAPDPLITPARVPIANERIRASVLYPLDSGFAAVVDKEVDGEGSLPAQIEINPSRRISQVHAATRAARAVFLCSAPLVGRPNAGLSDAGLRLACVEPGDQLAIFGEALRELKLRATYLYEEAGRYWFSTQPNMNRAAEDRAKALPEHAVDEAICRGSEAMTRESKGGFDRVFPRLRRRDPNRRSVGFVGSRARPLDPSLGQGGDAERGNRSGQRCLDAMPRLPAPLPQHADLRRGGRRFARDGSGGDAACDGLGRHRRRRAPPEAADAVAGGRRKGQREDEQGRRGAGRTERLEPYSVPGEDRRDGSRQGVRAGTSGAEREGQGSDTGRRLREGARRRRRVGEAGAGHALAEAEAPVG